MRPWLSHIALALLAGVLCCGPLTTAQAVAQARPETLYQRLGGYDALAAVVDDFLGRLASDPRLARFFQGSSTDSRRQRRQHLVEQLCAAAGGPCYYTGRSMKTAHQGLAITEAEWDVTVKHLVESLEKFQVRPAEKEALLQIISGVKADIVETDRNPGRAP